MEDELREIMANWNRRSTQGEDCDREILITIYNLVKEK